MTCLLNRFLLFALVASQASAFVPSQRTLFGSRIKRKPTAIRPPSFQTRSASHYSSSSIQLGFLPPDLLVAQEEVAKQSANFLSSYAHLLQVHPISTKAITASILACAGDAIAQWRSDSSSYDLKRGAAFLFFGGLYTGAFQHFWFDYMIQNIANWGDMLGIWGPERVSFPVDLVFNVDEWWRYFDIVSQLENPPSPQALAAGKVALNQFLVIPMVYMPLFFAITGLVSGLDANESKARARSLYFPLLKRNWAFWLPTQFLQFLVIPVDFQIPFVSAASLVWTIILSSIGGGSTAPSAPSQIVAYETLEEGGEEIVTISKVEPGAVNQITDDVLLEDVEKALIPDGLVEVAADARTQLATGGLAAGLLSGAADEGAIGSVVGGLINVEEGAGVAVVAAVGAGLGLLAASGKKDKANDSNSTSAELYEDDDDDDDAVAAVSQDGTPLQSEIEQPTRLIENDATQPTYADTTSNMTDAALNKEEEKDMAVHR